MLFLSVIELLSWLFEYFYNKNTLVLFKKLTHIRVYILVTTETKTSIENNKLRDIILLIDFNC